MKYGLVFCCFLLLFACNRSNSSDKVLLTNNFDGLQGWGVEHSSLTQDRAFSGKYAVKIDRDTEFGIGFSRPLAALTNKKPKKILVEMRAWIPESHAKANFVCEIAPPDSGKSKFRQGFNLVDKTKDYREWVKISKRLVLPDNIELQDTFRCFLWRPEASEEVVYIDDLKITVLE